MFQIIEVKLMNRWKSGLFKKKDLHRAMHIIEINNFFVMNRKEYLVFGFAEGLEEESERMGRRAREREKKEKRERERSWSLNSSRRRFESLLS